MLIEIGVGFGDVITKRNGRFVQVQCVETFEQGISEYDEASIVEEKGTIVKLDSFTCRF